MKNTANKNEAADARVIALRILENVEKRSAYAEALLDAELKKSHGMDSRDKALATDLVYGVLRWRYRLDKFIFSTVKTPKIHPKALMVLRLGAYQLLYLDRIPKPAAVHATVSLLNAKEMAHLKGFVNAVLRKIASGEAVPEAVEEAELLSLDYSLPPWLALRWTEELGLEGARALARQSIEPPPLFLRVDVQKRTVDEALSALEGGRSSGRGAYSPVAVYAQGAGDPRSLSPVKEGWAIVQGQASQMIPLVLAPKPGWRVLDACAAPGGKTTHIAQLMGDQGEVVALELHPHRAQGVTALAGRLGLKSIKVEVADATKYATKEKFDGILVDAPCTGAGTLARTPEKKWRLAPEDIEACARVQLEILNNLAGALKPGGVLVYSTCTVFRRENEQVVEEFLAGHPDFYLEKPQLPQELIGQDMYYKTFPPCGGDDPSRHMDGFFAARMRLKA